MKSKLEVRAAWSGEVLEFPDPFDRVGPTGGRNILDGIWVVAKVKGDTTVAVIEGEDLARSIARIIVNQHDGVQRYNLTGDELRVVSYAMEGADRYTETADAAVANDVTHTIAIYVPFTKRFAHTPEDFALPVDWLKSVQIQTPAAASDLSVGGTFALDTSTYYLLGVYREVHDVQLYSVDRIFSAAMAALDEHVLPVNGKLHDLYFHKRGAAGGTALTNLSTVRVDELGIPPLDRTPDLDREYRRKRNMGGNLNSTIGGEVRSDPFTQGKAAAMLLHDKETSVFDGKILRTAKIGLTNTEASLRTIARVVTPASETIRNQTNAAFGLTPASYRAATDAKTRVQIEQWPPHMRPYLRLKADMPKAA